MKATLLFLLLINLLFFGWSQWVAAPPGGAVSPTPEPKAEQIALYTERYPDRPDAAGDVDVTALAAPIGEPPATALALSAEDDAPEVAAEPATEEPAESVDSEPAEDDPADDPPVVADTDPEAPAAEQVAIAAPARCVRLGPFLRLAEAADATATLKEQGLAPSQRIEQAEVWVGHWVYLPRFDTRAEAIAAVEQLRAGGVTDNYIETSGALRNRVSLGLFSDIARAQARAASVRELGVEPEIGDRMRTGDVYFLLFELPDDRQVEADAFTTQPRRPVSLTDVDCEQVNAARASDEASAVS